MKREALLKQLRDGGLWDVLIIGGGATGLGTAVEAAGRGLKVVLVEQSDFCKGTSSKSTKLIHGGVRYLEQGNLRLVADALRERRHLLQNAPHLVRPIAFVIPLFRVRQRFYYGTGLKLYDFLARERGLTKSRYLPPREAVKAVPNIRSRQLRGGIEFYDALFDDAGLGICLARTAADHGAVLLNYLRLDSFLKVGGRIAGGIVRNEFTNEQIELKARVVVNATGPFSDWIRRLDDPKQKKIISPSRGSHIVLDHDFLPGEKALLIPRTRDGRVIFAIPWMGRVLCGTTDTAVNDISLEPRPRPEDLEFLLQHLGEYMDRKPAESDIRSAFAGFRPLVRHRGLASTASMPRDHTIEVSAAGLVSIAGGKWTTYRKMAPLYGSPEYGKKVEEVQLSDCWKGKDLGEKLVNFTGDCFLDVIRAVQQEWACTVEDVLARRTRILFLDARKAAETAPIVAEVMARELGYGVDWETEQVRAFRKLAERYLP